MAEVKAKLSEVLRETREGPVVIHNRGKDLAVIVDIEEWERLSGLERAPVADGAAFLARVEAIKRRYGGGIDDFQPARFDFVPALPFEGKKRRAR